MRAVGIVPRAVRAASVRSVIGTPSWLSTHKARGFASAGQGQDKERTTREEGAKGKWGFTSLISVGGLATVAGGLGTLMLQAWVDRLRNLGPHKSQQQHDELMLDAADAVLDERFQEGFVMYGPELQGKKRYAPNNVEGRWLRGEKVVQALDSYLKEQECVKALMITGSKAMGKSSLVREYLCSLPEEKRRGKVYVDVSKEDKFMKALGVNAVAGARLPESVYHKIDNVVDAAVRCNGTLFIDGLNSMQLPDADFDVLVSKVGLAIKSVVENGLCKVVIVTSDGRAKDILIAKLQGRLDTTVELDEDLVLSQCVHIIKTKNPDMAADQVAAWAKVLKTQTGGRVDDVLICAAKLKGKAAPAPDSDQALDFCCTVVDKHRDLNRFLVGLSPADEKETKAALRKLANGEHAKPPEKVLKELRKFNVLKTDDDERKLVFDCEFLRRWCATRL